jgi:sarcosine oxidase
MLQVADPLTYDVVVVGLGAMGAAAVDHLSQTGLRVLGIEQFQSPHALGSSHGETRIIRQAYFEDPRYVPLLQRAYTLWEDLERRSGEVLLHLQGGLMLGPASGELIQGTLNSVRTHHLPHSYLTGSELQQHDLWRVPGDYAGVYEDRAGYLLPEKCIAAQLHQAAAHGASLWQNTRVEQWEPLPTDSTSGPLVLQTSQGEVRTHKLILTTGAWMPETYPRSAPELTVTRQSLFWFEPSAHAAALLEAMPIFLLEMAPEAFLYGFPLRKGLFKVALHQPGEALVPEQLPHQAVSEAEVREMTGWLETYLRLPVGPCVKTQVCMYTNTSDGHFRWYNDPETPDVLALSPCSGHGFKFASVMGELAKRWACEEDLGYDLRLFQPERLA